MRRVGADAGGIERKGEVSGMERPALFDGREEESEIAIRSFSAMQ